MILALLLGVATVFYGPPITAPPPLRRTVNMRHVLAGAYLALLAIWYAMVSAYTGNFFSLEGSVEVKLGASGDPVIYVVSLMLVPGLCYALARQPFRVAIALVLLTVFIVFFSGSRSRILYALVPFAFYLVMARQLRLRRSLFVIGVLAFGFVSIAVLNLRTLVSYNRTVSAEQTFAVSNPLNLPDIAAAEANIEMSRMNRHQLAPYTGDSLVSFVTAPIPRSVLPFKPPSGSVQFTMAYDPARWRTTSSGLVIGALNEIEYDYPYPIALVITWLFGAGWAFAMLRAIRSPSIHAFSWTVALYIFILNFFRGDLFLAGGMLFVAAFYWAVVSAYRRIRLSDPSRQAQAAPGQPGLALPPR